VLVICAVRGKSSGNYIHRSLGEVQLHVCQDLVGDGLCQMLHIGRQTPGGFLQPIHQWSYLGPA
jgi:hypothetical protein